MIISTIKHDYFVIHKLKENPYFETFLCVEENSIKGRAVDSNNRYRVLKLKDKLITVKLISFFTELKNHSEFSDYYECFSKDGFLYLVFKNSDYPLLKDKLVNENCSLRERLEIGRNLIEHVLMLDMPDFILYDALSEYNVTVSASLNVYFNYTLTDISQYETLGIFDVIQQMDVLYKQLFEYELAQKASIDIENFIHRLDTSDYKDYLEVFKEYEMLYEKFGTGNLLQSVKPNTFLYRMWEKIKRLTKYVKPVVAAIIVILIAGYLIYSILTQKNNEAAATTFERIGTVTIESSSLD